jgi:hypothetical protein
VKYLLDNRGDARFLVAVPTSAEASPLILATGEPVMALGGFGGDQILTADELAHVVEKGELRFLLLPGEEKLGSMPGGKAGSPPPKMSKASATGAAGGAVQAGQPKGKLGSASKSLASGLPVHNGVVGWVQENCVPVPPEQWRSKLSDDGADALGSGPMDIMTLYDCGGETR